MVRKYQEKYGSVSKESLPTKPTIRLELDETPFLDISRHKEYQHIIGVRQWLVVSGRYNIMYAVLSLSRFSAAPREGHLELARRLIGYLKKYLKKGYVINHHPLKHDLKYEKVKIKLDFGIQYKYFHKDINDRFPCALMDELPIYIFCDADCSHDKITSRSISASKSAVEEAVQI
eukprot:15336697-Ditylum_brightwellii.AAC.1